MAKELNDFRIKDLPKALRRETLMESYWDLAPRAREYCQKLAAAGIKSATDLFAVCEDPDRLRTLVEETEVPDEYLRLLDGILRFNRFKPVPLTKIESLAPRHLKALQALGIRDTGALLLAGRTRAARQELAGQARIPMPALEGLLRMADLMRMPGIKNTRARLYLEAGIDCVAEFARQEPGAMRDSLVTFVESEKTNKPRTAPLPKEIATGIAWAKILPVVIKF